MCACLLPAFALVRLPVVIRSTRVHTWDGRQKKITTKKNHELILSKGLSIMVFECNYTCENNHKSMLFCEQPKCVAHDMTMGNCSSEVRT